ncbi:hypothetical protein SAMN06295974_3817 [Plantibacter flavus]|uniref:Uncharacterized protein n=1 Tax=Plantibacter flavus TaxID=150123 RepID=A0A3N2BL97_9MICO|nr:hypothetical protein [Plantibacter flavus]ROR76036.1 hypothetical protein EDD42_3989 [Plantibacter flavus]SMG49085.1 hypothetical protein SAMN06295974_3817 [Plantibacter flavus]
MTQLTSREARDWELFVDWCVSMSLAPLPTSGATTEAFLEAFPAAAATQIRRRRVIHKQNSAVGVASEAPVSSALRHGDGWASVSRALAQVPKYHYPTGFQEAVRGRRDGWLIVLVGVLGMNRQQAVDVTTDDVTVSPHLSICGQAVERSESADECAACAVTRWLRVVGDLTPWFNKAAITRVVSPIGVEQSSHDCGVDVDRAWKDATTLLPSINRHGHPVDSPLSLRSISATMARRQQFGEVATIQEYTVRTGGRFANATSSELAAAQDDVDARLDEMSAWLKALLAETTETLDHLTVIGL